MAISHGKDTFGPAKLMQFFRLKWLPSLIMLAGTGWAVYLLVSSMEDPRRYLPSNGLEFALATLLIAASFATNWFLFYNLLSGGCMNGCTFWNSIHLHTAGQLLRYLPGRIWGVLYQITASQGQIPPGRIARANLDLMVFLLTGSCAVACLILGVWPTSGNLFLAAIGLAILTGQVVLFMGGADRLLFALSTRLPGKFRGVFTALSQVPLSLSRFLVMQAVFSLGWLLYLYGWSRLGNIFPVFADVDFVALAVFYTLASVVGILSVVTPAGLGVRELVFLLLASSSTGQEAAAFFAVFGRIWFMLIELLLLIAVQAASLYTRQRQ